MDPIKNVSKEDAIKLLNKMQEEGNLNIAEEMLQDNKINFKIKDKKYRVRLLNLGEKEELDNLRRKKFTQLILDKDILLEKDLIKAYKDRDIDIDELTDKMKKLENEIHEKQLALGESISKNEGETILMAYAEQIKNLEIEKQIIFLQKNALLEFTLENQLLGYVAEIITYLVTEIENEEESWERVWNSIEEFNQCSDNELINKAATSSMILQYTL
jgi:hypothetical protein